MVWWSWKHCQDCCSDVSGSESAEFQEARMASTIFQEYLVVLSKHISRAGCWPDTVDLASCLRWAEDLKNWVSTELRHFGNGQSIVVKMKWFLRNLETLVFVSGYFLCRRWTVWWDMKSTSTELVEAMLFGMDCLVQEVHVTWGVLVSEVDENR